MPTADIIEGVKIEYYSGDHPPPHIHATYSGQEVLITIKENEIYAGKLSKKKLAIAMQYVNDNKEDLLALFEELNPPNHK